MPRLYYRNAGGLSLTRRTWRRRASQVIASATTAVIAAINHRAIGRTKLIAAASVNTSISVKVTVQFVAGDPTERRNNRSSSAAVHAAKMAFSNVI